MLFALCAIAILLAAIAAALFGILGTLVKTKAPVFNIAAPKIEIPPVVIPDWKPWPVPEPVVVHNTNNVDVPKIDMPAFPDWPKQEPVVVNVAVPDIVIPEFPKPEVVINNDVNIPPVEIPAWPEFPEQKTPMVIVRLVPSEVDVHPAVKLPVLKEGVMIIKKTGQVVGTRDIDHPDVFEAQKDPELTVQWPDGQIGDIMPPNFRTQS